MKKNYTRLFKVKKKHIPLIIVLTLCVVFSSIILVSYVIYLVSEKSIQAVHKQNIKVSGIEQEFLLNNYTNLELNNSFSQFRLLESSLKNNEIFFTGETHGISINPELEFEFIKFFHEKGKVNYILLESPYYFGEFINQYLETGDEAILFKLYKFFDGPLSLTKEKLEYWRNIYIYNNNLPNNKKLKFVGVDVIMDFNSAIWYLQSILPEKEVPSEIYLTINKLNKLHQKLSTMKTIKNLIDGDTLILIDDLIVELNKDMTKNSKIYEKYLGENYFSFDFTVKNILQSLEFLEFNGRKWNGPLEVRDQIPYHNFIKIYKHLPKGKYFGQWGSDHITQHKTEHGERIATLMNQPDSPVKNKVVTILFSYINCYNIDPNTNAIKKINNADLEIFEPFLVSDITLFKLIGENSPFYRDSYIDNDKNNSKTNISADCFQFLVIIKNSNAMTMQ